MYWQSGNCPAVISLLLLCELRKKFLNIILDSYGERGMELMLFQEIVSDISINKLSKWDLMLDTMQIECKLGLW
jgi:hypothetical protein